MQLPVSQKSVLKAAAIALLLCIWSLLTSARAEASCGDYVMVGGKHSAHHSPAAAKTLAVSDTNPADKAAQPRQKPTVPCPCQGTSCSNDSFPPASPSPKINATGEHWGMLSGMAWQMPRDMNVALAEIPVAACDGVGLSLLRPPR